MKAILIELHLNQSFFRVIKYHQTQQRKWKSFRQPVLSEQFRDGECSTGACCTWDYGWWKSDIEGTKEMLQEEVIGNAAWKTSDRCQCSLSVWRSQHCFCKGLNCISNVKNLIVFHSLLESLRREERKQRASFLVTFSSTTSKSPWN